MKKNETAAFVLDITSKIGSTLFLFLSTVENLQRQAATSPNQQNCQDAAHDETRQTNVFDAICITTTSDGLEFAVPNMMMAKDDGGYAKYPDGSSRIRNGLTHRDIQLLFIYLCFHL